MQKQEKGRIKEIRVYKFDELEPDAQQKVLDDHRSINVDYNGWWEQDGLLAPESFSSKGEPLFNYNFREVEFDLEYRGYLKFGNLKVANYEAFRLLLGIPEDLWERIDYQFDNTGRNSDTALSLTSNTMEDFNETERKIIEKAEDKFKTLMEQAKQELKDNYNYLTSDESIKDTLEANEYEFEANGSIA